MLDGDPAHLPKKGAETPKKFWPMFIVAKRLDGVAPCWMVGVSVSVNLPLHHKVNKFSSGTGSPGWSWKKGRKTVVVWYGCVSLYDTDLYISCLMSVPGCVLVDNVYVKLFLMQTKSGCERL